MCGISKRENREILLPPSVDGALGRIGKARGRTPMMDGSGKSYGPIVPTKLPNKGEPRRGRSQGEPYAGTTAETPETAKGRDLQRGNLGRRNQRRRWRETSPAKGNADWQNMPRTQSRQMSMNNALDRVRQAASSGLTVGPEAGTQCGSSARWGLYGGRPDPLELRAVPTVKDL